MSERLEKPKGVGRATHSGARCTICEALENRKMKWESLDGHFCMDVMPVEDGMVVFTFDVAFWRKVIVQQWYPSDAPGCYIDLLTKLLAANQRPKALWVDPCTVASCKKVQGWCNDHGIVMRFAGPTEPTMKGKMERAFNAFQREYENRRKSHSRTA